MRLRGLSFYAKQVKDRYMRAFYPTAFVRLGVSLVSIACLGLMSFLQVAVQYEQ